MKFQFVGITKIIEENACQIAPLRHMMFAYYRSIITREVHLSKVTKEDHILCIGGGYMPCTAILFHKISGAQVTIIDNDKKTLHSAQKLVDVSKVSDKVKVVFCDGKDIDSSEFDMIHIAMQVSPKTVVVDHIYGAMKEGAKLLIRCPKKHLQAGYNNLEEGCYTCNGEFHRTEQCININSHEEPSGEVSTGIASSGFVKQNCLSNIGRTYLYVKEGQAISH